MARLSNSQKKQVKALIDQASRALGNGRSNVCEQLCAKIEKLHPGNPHAANLRAIICSNAGQPDRAIALFEQATAAAPQQGEFHANLAKLYMDRERYEDALRSYRQAIKCGVRTLPVVLHYSRVLIDLCHYQEADDVLEEARKRHPHDMDVLLLLSQSSYESYRITEAKTYLQTILEDHPDHFGAHYSMAQLAMHEGRFDEAEDEIRKCLAADPNHIGAYEVLVQIKKYDSEDDTDIADMVSLHEQAAPDSTHRMQLGFAIAKIMEDIGQYDRAFSYFSEGNDIRRRHSSYNSGLELAHMQAIIDAYTPEVFSRTSELDDSTPIFIVGMPRCGSTLAEQILAAHPDVSSKGECHLFEDEALSSVNNRETPLTLEDMVSFSVEQWRDIGGVYLNKLKTGASDALRITDKTLGNIRMVGAIHCALPKARIVHVRRHPIDTCLSIYKRNIVGTEFDFGCDFDELGDYYQMYLKLMQHWRDVLPEGVMYELTYEKLIADQEDETRKLLDACGLNWNEQCLEFYRARNTVRTASVAQVRQSIYKDSMAAWKRYEKQLQPLIHILGTEYAV